VFSGVLTLADLVARVGGVRWYDSCKQRQVCCSKKRLQKVLTSIFYLKNRSHIGCDFTDYIMEITINKH
jgi:hypothetical protein